jgi:hypothetical protein
MNTAREGQDICFAREVKTLRPFRRALLRHTEAPQSPRPYLLKRPVGRPSNDVCRSHARFTYQAGSWTKARRVTRIRTRPQRNRGDIAISGHAR